MMDGVNDDSKKRHWVNLYPVGVIQDEICD